MAEKQVHDRNQISHDSLHSPVNAGDYSSSCKTSPIFALIAAASTGTEMFCDKN
jgi:hypothetical protein